MPRHFRFFLLLLAASGAAISQTDPVIRIDVDRVQVDAVVTDSKGRQVTDLKPEDFEITADGKPQAIVNFSYVRVTPLEQDAGAETHVRVKDGPPLPPVHLRPQDVRRTIVLMVDDLGLSFESTNFVRRALKKFVDEQMQPGDMVAIMRTRAGMGALQQFTGDRDQLYKAIEHVRWYPLGGGVSAFAPITNLGNTFSPLVPKSAQGLEQPTGSRQPDESSILEEHLRADRYIAGTLGGIQFVLRGLRDVPGRKALVLFSDGISIFPKGEHGEYVERTLERIRELTDQANRSAVILYTVDARGLPSLAMTAEDRAGGEAPIGSDFAVEMRAALKERRDGFYETQSGLDYLAHQTGGFFLHDSNDLNWGIRRVLDDLSGYYLLSYKPPAGTFPGERSRREFHKIHLRVRGRGLTVRSRTGFFGLSDEQTRPVYRTPAEEIVATLMSPFNGGAVGLRLTSLFSEDDTNAPVLRNLLHINARDVSFANDSSGEHTAELEVYAMTFGEQGVPVDQHATRYEMRLTNAEYAAALENGLLYRAEIYVKKPGAYQVRALVRDTATNKTGVASQFMEVPDIRKKGLTLSSVVLSNTPGAYQSTGVAGAGTPAVRVYQKGATLNYGYLVLNPVLDRDNGKPSIETRVRLFRDGQSIYEGPVSEYAGAAGKSTADLYVSGKLQLGAAFATGEYMLQVIAKDRLAAAKKQMATQWMDFEVVN